LLSSPPLNGSFMKIDYVSSSSALESLESSWLYGSTESSEDYDEVLNSTLPCFLRIPDKSFKYFGSYLKELLLLDSFAGYSLF
jgi:hypothetical protein